MTQSAATPRELTGQAHEPNVRAGEPSAYHERARGRGAQIPILLLTHILLRPLIHVYFRLNRTGRHHIPREGPVILAANHRSFLDPFVIACCLRRPIYCVAKRELFERRIFGWLLNALGAFPIRRGESDDEAMTTARMVLERGGAVVIFSEGTRIRSGPLAKPKRGVGRLALETGAPVVPVAIAGTERVRSGWRVRPRRVGIRCGPAHTFPRVETPSPNLAAEVTERIWSCVELQWEWLGGLPPLRSAAVVGAGSMGKAFAMLLARAGVEVRLGARTGAQADELRARVKDTVAYPCLAGVRIGVAAELDLADTDLVVLAVPATALPTAVAQLGDTIEARSAVLVVSKGLVSPSGTTASRYVSDRLRTRAVAALGGPAHAREAVELGASVVLAASDQDSRAQLAEVLGRSGLVVEQTDDVIGTELAGCAKNAAALAAAAAAQRGMNAAGAAAGRVFAEIHKFAILQGARSETFAGLAGAGDLVGTVIAERSRNRQAGELLGQGVPAEQIPAMINGTAEGLDAVPLLVEALEAAGVDAPATADLGALIEGRLSPDEWAANVRAPAVPGTQWVA